MELALSAITDGVVWMDSAGVIQWCNEAFDQLCGRPHVYILGSSFQDLLVFKPDTLSGSDPLTLVLQNFMGSPRVFECAQGGRTRFLEITGRRIPLKEGPINAILSLRDVTEKKIFEAKEKQFSDQALAVAQKEYQRAQELDQAYKRLKEIQTMLLQSEKMSVIGQLASGVAHEVKNPLGVILNSIRYLELTVKPGPEDFSDILETMRDAVQRANRIVAGLLDFSRPAPLELQAVSLGKIIDASLNLTEKQMTLRQVKVIKEIPGDLPSLQADPNEIEQVFINLFLNALQAMPDGGTLTIRAFTRILALGDPSVGRRLTDKFRPGETGLICEVQDTGCGIPAENLEKVFHPFFTTKPPGEGTGLGLPLVKSMIENHGGILGIESEKNRGTKIILVLPVRA